MFEDKSLQCADCGQEFIFTAGEQEFYERKGFREIPKRCKPCRDARKVRRESGESAGGGYEERGAPGARSKEMFDAVCAACGTATRVPFRPTPGRAVYCRGCYASVAGSNR